MRLLKLKSFLPHFQGTHGFFAAIVSEEKSLTDFAHRARSRIDFFQTDKNSRTGFPARLCCYLYLFFGRSEFIMPLLLRRSTLQQRPSHSRRSPALRQRSQRPALLLQELPALRRLPAAPQPARSCHTTLLRLLLYQLRKM